MDLARLIAETRAETDFDFIRQIFEWLVSEDGPEMDDEDALVKALELTPVGVTMKKLDLLRRKFEWAHSSNKGPESDTEQALAWALSKVIG